MKIQTAWPGTATGLLLALALLLVPASGAAQARTTLSISPVLGVTWPGHRFEYTEPLIGPDGDSGTLTMGPTSGLELGIRAEIRITPRFSVAGGGTYSALDFKQESDDRQKQVAGDQSLLRFTGGVQYRVVGRAPGFFSLGVAAAHFDPKDDTFVEERRSRTELGGYGGLGLDIGGADRHLRVEARVYLMSVDAEPLQGTFPLPGSFESEDLAVDYSLSMAFMFPLF